MSQITGISGMASQQIPGSKKVQEGSKTFNETLNGYLENVNGMIQEAGDTVEKMANGDIADMHQVMIAVEKASIGLEMVVEIRNKLLESYRELMRTQV